MWDVLTGAPASVQIVWIACAGCTILSLARWWTHRRSILMVRRSEKRQLTLTLIFLGPAFALTTFLPLFFVRSAALFEVLRSLQEALAIHAFSRLIIELLGGEGEALQHLQQLPEGKYITVPPVCCLCKPCARQRPFTKKLMRVSLNLVEQFVYVVPACAALGVWVELEKGDSASDISDALEITLDVVQVISLTLAMYGLFIIFLAVRHSILRHRAELKLLVIKLIVIVGTLQVKEKKKKKRK